MSQLSPNKKIVKKLLRNYTAVAGITVITLVTIMGIFAYLIAPDNTENANQQFPVLAEQAPGSTFKFVALKSENPLETSWINWFNGYPIQSKLIPIETYTINNDGSLHIEEYKGNGFPAIAVEVKKSELLYEETAKNIVQKTFWLGTDQLGRDVLSRLIVGARVSILVGLVAVIISTVLGMVIGSLAGFYRGWIDSFIMWQLSVVWSIPTLLLAMALYISLKDTFDSSYMIIFIAIGCTMWVSMARIVRGQILGIREIQFVEAANSLGYSDARIIFKHIVPNIMAPVIVIAAANFANAILIEAGLSFLGLGMQPPTPSWGGMLSEFKDLVGTKLSYLAFFPGVLIMILVLSFNLVGNGLRDAMDIKNK